MADYTNTRTLMGDQAAFDALIAGTLEDLVEDGVTSVDQQYAIYYNDGIESINFPNVTNIAQNGIRYNSNLKVVDIGKACTFGSYSLGNNVKLDSLILRGSTKSSGNSNMLGSTPIALDNGGVFVPSSLISAYKADSNWNKFLIFPIDDYPKSSWETISDSWAEILAAEANDTYATKYSVGDTKTLQVGNNLVHMQIAAIDSDELADSSGNAKITWLCKNCYTTHRMNATGTTTGGWPSTEMRSWLISDVLSAFPSEVAAAVKEVKKTYYDYGTTSTLTSNDKIWIPSYREVMMGTDKENSGVQYPGLFGTSTGTGSRDSRVKYDANGSASLWWLRSAVSGGIFYCVGNNGSVSSNYAYDRCGVVFGFCT